MVNLIKHIHASIVIVILILCFNNTIKAQNTDWVNDSLFFSIWENPESQESIIDHTVYRTLGDKKLCAIREFYDKKRKRIKRQYVSYQSLAYGIESRFSKKGELTYVFDNSLGVQLFGTKLSFNEYRVLAKSKSDSIIKKMFPNQFIKNNIRFSSDIVYLDYKLENNFFTYSVHLFDELQYPPTCIRFYYPFNFDGKLFTRQVFIEFDTSLNIVESFPPIDLIDNYEFNIEYKSALIKAKELGFINNSKTKKPFLHFDSDYIWYFPMMKLYEKSKFENGVYLKINAKTNEISYENYEVIIITN